jgi:scyllo-inositol 2-dehydrogenase (NADP+)
MIRVGLAGYGLAGEVFHAPLVDATDGLALAGIVTGDPERAARARAAHPAARVVPSVEELWGVIDVLVVATPNRAHVELGLAALERGLAVVVDKPIAPTAADAERLLAAGGRLTVFQNRRWDGDFLTLRGLADGGALGPLVRLESRFERFRPEVDDGWRESGDDAEGGGLLLDLGAHLVDQAILLLGPVVRVYAQVAARRPGAETDDDVLLALEHEGGAASLLWMSATAPLAGPRFTLTGLRAGFACDGLDPQEAQLAAGARPGDPGWGRGPRPGRLVDETGARDVELAPGRYEDFYAGVVTWLARGGPPPVDPRDSLRGLEVLEAARESGARHTTVHTKET